MSRSTKSSDEDFEPKAATHMQTRKLTVQSVVNSPLRRSSRIKQNKYSPGSPDSDNSNISINQPTRSTRSRTATMDSNTSETMKLRVRKHSISSDISEMIDVDVVQTPTKRTTRKTTTITSVSTPTRVNTRASKRHTRAGSEIQSPLPTTRTRRTRASSVDPESLSDQSKSLPNTPIKTRRRASVVPSSSPVKEQTELEDHIPYVRVIDSTIVETEEITNSEYSNTSQDKAPHFEQNQHFNKKRLSMDEDEVKDDCDHESSIDLVKSDETLKLLKKNDEIQVEDMDEAVNIENTLAEEQSRSEKTVQSDNDIIDVITYDNSQSSSVSSCKKGDKEIVKENLSDTEKSLTNVCKSEETSEETSVTTDHSLNVSIEEIKNNISIEEIRSNKENQTVNIIGNVPAEKNMQSNVTSTTKSLASPLMNKSLNEKETKLTKRESNLDKRRHSRESMGHTDLLKKPTESSQEMMDISVESLNSTDSNEIILSKHDSIEIIEKANNNDKLSIESINTSIHKEDTTKMINESDKIDKIECIITDNKTKNIESNEVDKTSRLSISRNINKAISDSKESLTSIVTTDDKEEQSPRQDENEVSSNVCLELDSSIDSQIPSPIKESSNNQSIAMDKQSVGIQDEAINYPDSPDSTKQKQESLFEHVTKSASNSNNVLERSNSTGDSNENDTVIQVERLSDVEVSEKSAIDISIEKTDAVDTSFKKAIKHGLKRKSVDVLNNLETEKESSPLKANQKDQEDLEIVDDVSDINVAISLFQNVPADKWEKENDIKTDSVQSTSQTVEEEKNENELENEDLILVNKQAWLTAESIKAAKEAEPFEYDSDDTVLLKSKLDVIRMNYAEKLDIIDEESMDVDSEEEKKQIKRQKSRTKKRLVTEIDEDFSENEDNLVTVDKSLNESKTVLNQSTSELNRSEQPIRIRDQSIKVNDESSKEIEADISRSNRNSLRNKKNISLRKSIEERKSLNTSSKDTSMQNTFECQSRIQDSEKKLDLDAHKAKKLQKKKHSLDKSCNKDADNDITESEENNLSIKNNTKKVKDTSLDRSVDQKSKSANIEPSNNDESDDNDINIPAMDLGPKTLSTIANAGSDTENSIQNEYYLSIPRFLFKKTNGSNDSDDDSLDIAGNTDITDNTDNIDNTDNTDNTDDTDDEYSDINKEYNLDGAKQKFDDDDVLADECRASEVEFSDSDDNGSDLADFIVDDDEIEDEVQEEKDDAKDIQEIYSLFLEDTEEDDESEKDQSMKEDDEAAQEEEVENKDEDEEHIDEASMESENEENEDVQEKDNVMNEKEDMDENILFYENETKAKQDIEVKKTGKTTFLSNSPIKKKKKSDTKKDGSLLLDTSNLISSGIEKKNKWNEQLHEVEFKNVRKLINCSTPNLNIRKKCEIDEAFKTYGRNSEDIKSDTSIQATLNTSLQKKKSKKDYSLNKDISLNELNDTDKEKMLNNKISPDLMKLLKNANTSKLSSKIKSCRMHTLNITDPETPTIKHLRKEKLNESEPTLKLNTDVSLLKKKSKMMQDTAQTKMKNKITDVITLSDNDVQELSQKIPKNDEKRKEMLSENITDKIISQGEVELEISKKKKRAKFSQLTVAKDNIDKNACQINEKMKKKKNREISEENIEILSESSTKLKKKKKYDKLTQLDIIENNIGKNACQNEKTKKKKKRKIEENTDKILFEDLTKLKISEKKKRNKFAQSDVVENNAGENVYQINEKMKKKKKRKTEENIDKILSEDSTKLKIKKKHDKFAQLDVVEDNTDKNACQINEKAKKKKKRETSEENTDKVLSEDSTKLKIPKKKPDKLVQLNVLNNNTDENACQLNEKAKKKKKREISEENNFDNILLKKALRLNLLKKKERLKLNQLNAEEDSTRENVYQISEKMKKRKKREASEENIFDEASLEETVELEIPKKRKRIKFNQLTVEMDNAPEDACQINKKEKKEKKTFKKNTFTDEALSEDVMQLKIPKKKKHTELNQLTVIENNTYKDIYQINKKKQEKNKKQINVTEQDKDISEDNVFETNIYRNKTKLAQHKKKNKMLSNLELNPIVEEYMMKKESDRQKRAKNIETLQTEKSLKKKRKKETESLPVQIEISKLMSKKNLPNTLRLQDIASGTTESKNEVFVKARDQALEAIRAAETCVKTSKELKKKKNNRVKDIEDAIHVDVPIKKKKRVKETSKPSSGLKRLSNDVIENLVDTPIRAKKKQRISRSKERIIPSVSTNKLKIKTEHDDSFTTSSSGTTKFNVTNLQKIKKQLPKSSNSSITTFKEFMFAMNNREPISACIWNRKLHECNDK
ncbi:hypothetical protein P5V15_000205 [Pogonomyrmex californicus]